ncbi:MAG: tRNA (adenosine(37)-N6)-threonylcarbamoyltransferase complex dimerization subunit type 1 TsaB [Gammaproteobacteria bacterium]|nr:tRNA (adenosine(37)-N6)-threonylcarbamoyltransferase complex dimerization subunit type 1 TsaB [Gammaproteobacteria bacterium]MDH3413179.1 tRNA (adenosine(37)-N6)-threonylcarbamoyltransferase complex dimerization subunit type 1 TsaB [Gammaproteobacteria bacterium]
MKLLALDTSTDACSAAVYADKVIHERYQVAPRRHAQLLLSMVDAVLGETQLNLSDLDALAFGRGPGSFTGVRIAAATAQGLAVGANLPVIPVSSLRALAQTAYSARGVRRCAAAFDARMDEVYYGAFEIDADGIARPVQNERVCLPEDLPQLPGAGWTGVGPGWEAYELRLCARLEASIERIFANILPRAGDVAVLGASGLLQGEAVSAEAALPVYLRDRVTRT